MTMIEVAGIVYTNAAAAGGAMCAAAGYTMSEAQRAAINKADRLVRLASGYPLRSRQVIAAILVAVK